MIENYLGYMEICMQLYTNQQNNKEIFECINKYEEKLQKEYEKISEEEKEILNKIIISKIEQIKIERSTTMLAQSIMLQDPQLKRNFPGHIRAQYSDKLKKANKEIHYLESIYRSMNSSKGIKR